MILRKFRRRLPRAFKLLLLAFTAFTLTAPAQAQSEGKKGPPSHAKGWEKGKGHQNRPGPGTAPVPEPGTWMTMASLAAIAAVLASRRKGRVPA